MVLDKNNKYAANTWKARSKGVWFVKIKFKKNKIKHVKRKKEYDVCVKCLPREQDSLTVQDWISHYFSIFTFSQSHQGKTFNLSLPQFPHL